MKFKWKIFNLGKYDSGIFPAPNEAPIMSWEVSHEVFCVEYKLYVKIERKVAHLVEDAYLEQVKTGGRA